MGLHCFPLDPGDKRPFTYQGRRMKWGEHATADQETLKQWFTAWPDANYGVAARPSNLLIIDCDMGRDKDTGAKRPLPPRFDVPGVECGEDLLAEMTIQMGVPFPLETLTVRTPKGGAHYYFANSTGDLMSQAPIMQHWIDIRSNGGEKGGYVVGPGSTVDGRRYTVAMPPPIAPAPSWLVDMCRYREPSPRQPSPPRPSGLRSGTGKLDPLVNHFYASLPGNQSNALYWAACAAADDDIPFADAVSGFSANCPAPSREPWTYRDVESQVRSAYRAKGKMA